MFSRMDFRIQPFKRHLRGMLKYDFLNCFAAYIGKTHEWKYEIQGLILQMMTLILFIPFNTLTGLYVVSILFGLSQGGIVPSYALIVKKYLPNKDAAERIGLIIFFTIIGMSIGGWMSGKIYDYTNSYTLGFLNSILWNLLNVIIIFYLFVSFKKSKVSI